MVVSKKIITGVTLNVIYMRLAIVLNFLFFLLLTSVVTGCNKKVNNNTTIRLNKSTSDNIECVVLNPIYPDTDIIFRYTCKNESQKIIAAYYIYESDYPHTDSTIIESSRKSRES